MRSTWRRLALSLGLAGLSSASYAGGCFDVGKGQPRSLTGKLDYVIYPGPPGYADVQRGDTPEPTFVLRLPQPICITGDEFSNPMLKFSAVHVVPTKASGPLRRFLKQSVTMTFNDQMGAHTGHHHQPLVAWAVAVVPSGGALAGRPLDFVGEYGTAATVIRAFYSALADGQGTAASALIVPEKRKVAAFSPDALSRFYGGLREPIELKGISQVSASSFVARYTYATGRSRCVGRASVTTSIRNGRNFIQSIKALDGC